MSFQGDISSISLGDVFQNLAANRKTGTLRISSGGLERNVFFLDGKVVSSSSSADESELPIAGWLADKEVITQAQLEEALRRHRRAKKKPLGEILRDLGLVDLDDYKSYLSSLIQETVHEVLSFQEGTFEFIEGGSGDEPAHREAAGCGIEFTAQGLVMEAARRSDDWQKIRRHIPSENEIYIVPPADRGRLASEAGDDEVTKEIVRLLDGTRSLRQVIARLPYSRFDACRALADLIAAKKARPMDGSVITQISKGSRDPRQVIACLKTILEREPNNRQILEKLSELHEKVGQREESATCCKLLAISYLDDVDLKSAEKWLRRSLGLNPRDIVTWQKLLDTVRKGGDRDKLAAFGAEFTDHFRKLGLMEIVRDHLLEMVKLFPERMAFRLDLAGARFALGETKTCVDELLALGVEALRRQKMDDAEQVFGLVLKYDRDNQKARQLHERIRSGKLQRRRAFRRRAVRVACLTMILAGLCALVGYDFKVRSDLFRITRDVYAESIIEQGRHEEAIARIRALREKHPFSHASFRDAPLLIEALEARKAKAAPKSK